MLTQQSQEPTATISSKGQVTIPVAIRRHLGVKSYDKVAFVIKPDGNISLTQATYPDIASLQGAAGSLRQKLSWKEIKKIAYEERRKK